jgi:RNA polymerase sigma-70 factor (ECF subfamily)
MLSNSHDAEDVLQESFVNAFSKLKDFKGESTFGAWLKRIVINKCISQLRKNKLKLVETGNVDFEKTELNFVADYSAINPEYIHHAIKELPEGSRVIFNLFALEGYKHKEISELLGISESTSKTQYFRARSILMNKLSVTVNGN